MITDVDKEASGKETFSLLKIGCKISIINAALGKAPPFLVQSMPVVRGEVGDRRVTVLSDSDCNAVVVRSDLVSDNQLTCFTNPLVLLDRTVKYLPEAVIDMKTPYFIGSITAKCMENIRCMIWYSETSME